MQEKGNQNGQRWAKNFLCALDKGNREWEHLGLRQLSGMVIMVFAKTALKVKQHLHRLLPFMLPACECCRCTPAQGKESQKS